MDAIFNASWLHYLGIAVMVYGVALIWRGLRGGRGGERGLLRRGVPMLDRLEGWRRLLVGLTLTGLGAAWYWDALWLLILSLGFGYVELQESTNVIKAWRWGDSRRRAASSTTSR